MSAAAAGCRCTFALWGVGVASILVACTQSPPASRPAATAPARRSAAETVAELRAAREAQQYRQAAELLLPERGSAVVSTLLAVDDFLAANEKLCAWVRDHVAVGLAQTIDQSYLAGDLGPYLGEPLGVLSSDVQILDCVEVGETASVSFQVGTQLPPGRVHLRRIEGAWRVDPGDCCPPLLADAFHDLARGLDELRVELEAGHVSVVTLRDNRDVLVEKVKSHMRRGVSLLSKAKATTAPSRP